MLNVDLHPHPRACVHTRTYTHTGKDHCLLSLARFPSKNTGTWMGDISTEMRIPPNSVFLGWELCISFKALWMSSQGQAAFANAETLSYLIKAQTSIFLWEFLAALPGDVSSPRAVFRMQWSPEGLLAGWRPTAPACHPPSNRPPAEATEICSSQRNVANRGKENRLLEHTATWVVFQRRLRCLVKN